MFMRWLILIAVLVSPSALAVQYNCVDAAGRSSTSERPCPNAKAAKDDRPQHPPAQANPPTSGIRDASPYRRPAAVVVPPLPKVDLSGLPKDANGNPILMQGTGGSIVAAESRRGPINVLAACSVLVTRCVVPGSRTLDACFMSAPRCTTSRPWEEEPCCPPACWERYEALRIAGEWPMDAYDQTLFGGDDMRGGCVPLG